MYKTIITLFRCPATFLLDKEEKVKVAKKVKGIRVF